MNNANTKLKVGRVYRLSFPGIAARVLAAAAEPSSEYCYLVQSLVLRRRWWANERGEPDNIYASKLIVPAAN